MYFPCDWPIKCCIMPLTYVHFILWVLLCLDFHCLGLQFEHFQTTAYSLNLYFWEEKLPSWSVVCWTGWGACVLARPRCFGSVGGWCCFGRPRFFVSLGSYCRMSWLMLASLPWVLHCYTYQRLVAYAFNILPDVLIILFEVVNKHDVFNAVVYITNCVSTYGFIIVLSRSLIESGLF